MKAALTLLVFVGIITLLNGLHLNAPITCVLPFLAGLSPSIYDFVGVAVILTTLWGLHHLQRSRGRQPQGSESSRRFNWALVLVPAVWILMVWIPNHTQPALNWEEILDRFHIQGDERVRMSRLVALGVICVGAVVIKRIWVSNG